MAGVVGRAELTSALCFFGAFLTYAGCCKTGTLRTCTMHVPICVCNLHHTILGSPQYLYNYPGEERSYIFSIRPHLVSNYTWCHYVKTTMQGKIYCYTEHSIIMCLFSITDGCISLLWLLLTVLLGSMAMLFKEQGLSVMVHSVQIVTSNYCSK